MPKKQDKKTKNRPKTINKSRGKSRSGDSAMMLYHGPIRLPQVNDSRRTYKVNGTYYAACTTSAGGVIDLVFGNSPAVLNQWSSWTTLYHEYRVLGVELKYVPIKNITNYAYGFGNTVVDRGSSAALGGILAASNHASNQEVQMYNTWKRTARMAGTPDANWIPIASPAATFYIKIYSGGNTASQTIGGFFLEFLIEFRTLA